VPALESIFTFRSHLSFHKIDVIYIELTFPNHHIPNNVVLSTLFCPLSHLSVLFFFFIIIKRMAFVLNDGTANAKEVKY